MRCLSSFLYSELRLCGRRTRGCGSYDYGYGYQDYEDYEDYEGWDYGYGYNFEREDKYYPSADVGIYIPINHCRFDISSYPGSNQKPEPIRRRDLDPDQT